MEALKKLANKKSSVLLILMLILGVAVVAYPRRVNATVCSDSMLSKAASALSPVDPEALEKVVSDIEDLPGHEDDPNCLYVQFGYALEQEDIDAAQRYLERLEKVYDAEKGFSKRLGSNTKSISDLESNLDNLKRVSEIRKEGVIPFSDME